jgi:hypothetical protein
MGISAPTSPARPQANNNADAYLEVSSLSAAQQEQDRIAHSRARLREKHRQKQQRNRGSDSEGSGRSRSRSGGGGGGGGGSSDDSSDSSGEDYEKVQRTAVVSTRRRVASRDDGEVAPGGLHSGCSSPAHRTFNSNNSNNSSGGNLRGQAPAGAPPPRRARDALLLETAQESQPSPSVRVSLDDVIRRQPARRPDDAADAKDTSPRNGMENNKKIP